MKLTYETGIATLIQFIAISLLNIVTQITASVKGCSAGGSKCLTSIFTSAGFFMVIVIVFGFISMVGYTAQQRRSRPLSAMLIGMEFLVAVIAYHNVKANRVNNDLLGLITSVVDILLALWVIWLAFRLFRAGNRRIVAPERSRRRHRPSTDL